MACIWTLHGLEASVPRGAYMAEKLTELEHTPGVGANGGDSTRGKFPRGSPVAGICHGGGGRR